MTFGIPMTSRPIAAILFSLAFASSAFAQRQADNGDVHVRAHVGARVYIDGRLAGISLGETLGLTVQNIAAGVHTIRVTRSGYVPRELTVTVQPGTSVDVNMDDLRVRRRVKVRPREEPVDMTASSPPMTGDDTGTPGDGNWEINSRLEGDRARGHDRYELPAIDVNYGIGEDLQVTWELPWVVLRDHGDEAAPGLRAHGAGNTTLGLKYRFYDDEESGLSLAVGPEVDIRTPRPPGASQAVGEPSSILLPFLLTKDFKEASLTANASIQKSSDESRASLSAIFGMGTRLTQRVALLSELSVVDVTSADSRRIALRLGARSKLDENQVIFLAVGIDLNGGDDGLRHRYFSAGYQRFIGHGDR
jgi:hypothetical protein